MNAEIIIAGFTLGALGSLHCVGMCGPLALALPVHHLNSAQKIFALFLYQLGRVFTYSLFGLILGMAGRSIYLSGFQHWFSIIVGVVVLIFAIYYWILKATFQPSFLKNFNGLVQSQLARLIKSKRTGDYFLFGIANGFLPCGMVYMAVAAALTSTEIFKSVLFMACFGAGTLPAMMLIGYFGQFFSLTIRNYFKKALPFIVILMGIILILRGLNLGIPFISPILPTATSQAVKCQ
jgi:hypothetical protein